MFNIITLIYDLLICLSIFQMNISPIALARIYEEDFKQDMAALKVQILALLNLRVF